MNKESIRRGYLLDSAIDINDINEAKHLIGSGAEISTAAMLLAINKGNIEMAKLLLENNAPVTDISVVAAARHNVHIFRLIYYSNVPIIQRFSSICIKYV